ncbi:MAG: helix-turn-helix transcriptional regulator [Lawsonibacter sp.]|jgi:transcriptional regulator with XRE-family HTH domain|uniref:helix-turn-helix domain-containing protein n=1 Tax=Lawsonibacter sp. JLR.KK007 TaxID=3114293 RepID=UPI00216E4D7B|nr:helix-turn-helix transcriptional regulator [Lawsonibacter sp.]
MKLNEKIAWYRREKKLSQEELAARVGVSRQAVSKWELGEASPDTGKLLALSQALGVTADHLLNDAEGPEQDAPPPPPSPQTPSQPPQDILGSNLPGFIGKMVRRWGWLAGIYLALQGAGVTLVGLIARWGFGSMFAASNQMMSGFGMGGGWAYDGPPEMASSVMEALGVAPQVSPMSGVQSFFLGFTTLILVIGLAMVIGGLILAYVLWKRGKKGD